jgi:transposase
MSNCFTKQGRALPDEVREVIIDKWLKGSLPSEIARQLNLPRKTVANIVDRYLQTGSVEPGIGGNRSRTARTDDVILYTEFCKREKPSVYAEEIRKQLVENNVVLAANVPSKTSISRVLTDDLGYSYKKVKVIPKESFREDIQRKLEEYLALCSTCDARNMHFFDECSVIKTTGNRSYGHAAVGQIAYEIQRYASNATYTVNLLHSMFGVSHCNILDGASNGLELLNFFAEALEEEDIFGNPLLKEGDYVIMDNCGFHHANHVEPVLRDMLVMKGVTLIYQPPYHPVYNTCEYCFRFLKTWLRKNTELADRHTKVAIYDALSRISVRMSRNFFRHCGYFE